MSLKQLFVTAPVVLVLANGEAIAGPPPPPRGPAVRTFTIL
jgi:hypothetical protein